MRKKILILAILFMAFSLIGCKEIIPSDKKALKQMKNLKNYSCNVEYTFKNQRDEDLYEGKQYYVKDKGYRLDIGEDRTNVYIDDYIYVQDKKAGKKYTLIKDFDEVYKYTFINEILSLLSHPESKVYLSEEQEGYVIFEFIIPSVNRNIAKGLLYINSSTLKPELEKIYDLKGDERVEIKFKEFNSNETLDEEILKH